MQAFIGIILPLIGTTLGSSMVFLLKDKLNGLTNGADDYLTKPFHMDELLARVNIQLRKKGKVDLCL